MCTSAPDQPRPPEAGSRGSRRRRIWELDPHAHCSVLGVCMPIHVLRRVVDKAHGGRTVADDYELHCGAVTDCRYRSTVAEAVQRDLERRHALAVQQASRMKSTEALAAWWEDARKGHGIAGALWATLTHAHCTPALAHRIEGQVHMLQHQAGVAARVDLGRYEALLEENAVLAREIAAAQLRCTRQSEQHARSMVALQDLVVQLRGRAVADVSRVAALQADLQALEAAAPGLKGRFELAREVERLTAHCHDHQRALLQAQQEAERQRLRADELAAELERRDTIVSDATAGHDAESAQRLSNRAVLCVGGRAGSVPVYRKLIEGTGGRFLHHDGGEEDSDARLDATLAAADLVICQTGCVSHNAYWRVKDHCKRTGKRCVFVDSPSGAGLKRALLALVPATGS